MQALEEAKTGHYLQYVLNYDALEARVVLYNMRNLASMAGHELDHRFTKVGLGAGPEARVAAGILDLALGGGGCETAMYTIRQEIDKWIRTTPAHV